MADSIERDVTLHLQLPPNCDSWACGPDVLATATEGGRIMLAVKASVLGSDPTQHAADRWRDHRARSLARLVAWYRRGVATGHRPAFLRAAIRDAVADCGWPKLGWLKREVRNASANIAANLAAARRG